MKSSEILCNELCVHSPSQRPPGSEGHIHENSYEIMMLHEGRLRQIQEGQSPAVMEPGDITFAPPGFFHGTHSHIDYPCRFSLIYVHPSLLMKDSPDLGHVARFLEEVTPRASKDVFLIRQAHHREPLANIMAAMQGEWRNKHQHFRHQLRLMLGQWFHWLMREEPYAGKSLTPAEDSTQHRWMEGVLEYMHTHFHRSDLSVQEAISQVPMSRSQFFQAFKERFDITFSDKLNEIRLQHASRLLRDSSIPITDILYRVGYRNTSHFNRQFKANFGLSPRAYRRGA